MGKKQNMKVDGVELVDGPTYCMPWPWIPKNGPRTREGFAENGVYVVSAGEWEKERKSSQR